MAAQVELESFLEYLGPLREVKPRKTFGRVFAFLAPLSVAVLIALFGRDEVVFVVFTAISWSSAGGCSRGWTRNPRQGSRGAGGPAVRRPPGLTFAARCYGLGSLIAPTRSVWVVVAQRQHRPTACHRRTAAVPPPNLIRSYRHAMAPMASHCHDSGALPARRRSRSSPLTPEFS